MTQKLVGEITFSADNIPQMPTSTDVPDKKDWHLHSIFEFNGKVYKPVTQKASDSLENAVKHLQNAGFKSATKEGKRKPTSLRYAIQTTGVEDFIYLK